MTPRAAFREVLKITLKTCESWSDDAGNPGHGMSLHARHAAWLFLVPLIVASARAQSPVTVTFDPARPGSYGISSYSQNGVLFTADFEASFAHYSPGAFGYPQNGTAYLAVMREFAGFSYEGGSFRLDSIEVAEYSNVLSGPTPVRFTGYRTDGTIVLANAVTDGVFDGTGPLPDFETFTFDSRFTDLLRVTISPTIMIDNLRITPIPEPASIQLFAIGAGIMLLVAVWRKKVAQQRHRPVSASLRRATAWIRVFRGLLFPLDVRRSMLDVRC